MTTQMTNDEIFEKLRDVLSESFELERDGITREFRLMEDLEIDSIDAIDLLVQLRPMLGNAQIDPKYFRDMRTVGDVADGLEKLMKGGAAE